jgi:monovalent cation:H+ antiporter-2, CPA2 family
MQHETPLIAIIVIGFGLALVFGIVAQRLRISPLAGYLLAGVFVGPATPGFVGNQQLADQLAEIGVILLMFGVGLHFSLKDLLKVSSIAIPGAVVQMALATLLGMGLAYLLGWSMGAGLIFGLALSVASTVLLMRTLQERRILETERGHIAVGWLVVEDIATVLALVLAPALARLLNAAASHDGAAMALGPVFITIGITLLKVGAFVLVMVLVGRRVIPMILHYVAHTGSRELFRLAVLAVALGVAYGAAVLFGVSFALGAFFAGMVLAESQLSQRAAQEALPFRDAFAVLFFVSVGMLFDPHILLREPWAVLATILIITVGKSLAAFLIVLAFRHPISTALTISASLAQIGEFSFILAALGVELELMPVEGRDLLLAGSILSILLNPLFFVLLDRVRPWIDRREAPAADLPASAASPPEAEIPMTALTGHTVVIGYGRVGSRVADGLREVGTTLLVIEDSEDKLAHLHAAGIATLSGNAADPRVVNAANLAQARTLLIAIPNAFEAGQIVQQARVINPALEIIARAHSDAEVDHLHDMGSTITIMGEQEIARRMLAFAQAPAAEGSVGSVASSV